MFDGIDTVFLPAGDADSLRGLYRDVLGFQLVDVDESPDPGWREALALPASPERIDLLAKPGATGGAIALVQTPGLADVGHPGSPGRRGPYALDFYARDMPDLERRLEEAGWGFTSEAVHYDLPGTDIPVRERMLIQPVSGLLHAIVQHRPMGTRSILGTVETEECSEVVAAVCLTPDLAPAREFATECLGGREYFHGAFQGPAVERMLDMGPGDRLDGALFRGPTSANARLEFAWRPNARPADPTPTPRVVLGLRMPTDGADAWSAHGAAGDPLTVRWGRRELHVRRFASRYDAVFLLLQG